MGERGRYPKEFKPEAVRLLNSGDNPPSELAMEKRYDQQFKVVFEAKRKLLEPPPQPKRPVGFHPQG